MAIKIGITGGIGSGKSVVSRLLQLMGVPVYISDLETKQLMKSDASIRQGLIDLLGEHVYIEGELNKPMLAQYLFASDAHAAGINQLVHPCVKADFLRWAAQQTQADVVGIESAILLEAGFQSLVDKVVMVYAPREIRIARAIHRDNASRQAIEQRIDRQMDDEEKRLQADFVIVNDDCHPVIPQVCELLRLLSSAE